jgi:hypothetical protein
MGPCFGKESEPIPDPGDEPCSFVVKKKKFRSGYNVFNDNKEEWLEIKNESEWFSHHSEFEIENKKEELLVKVIIKGQDEEIKREVEWDGDSDDSNFSVDDLFDGDDDDEVKVKLKWKVKREATFEDANGNVFATLKVKMKGKSKAEATLVGEGDMQRKEVTGVTKLKKVYYALNWGGNDVELEVDNGHWTDWEREWGCSMFKAEYDAKWGVDEVKVKSTGAGNGAQALAVAFAVAYHFHPVGWSAQMHSRACAQASHLLGIHS